MEGSESFQSSQAVETALQDREKYIRRLELTVKRQQHEINTLNDELQQTKNLAKYHYDNCQKLMLFESKAVERVVQPTSYVQTQEGVFATDRDGNLVRVAETPFATSMSHQ
jgi:predicted RNase H-like nuclease (RuvC/YqgF family)